MTIKELRDLLATAGLPVAYHSFAKHQKPPYLIFMRTGAETTGSDRQNNELREETYLIELYTSQKDPTKEALIEKALDSLGVPYNCYEAYIEDEKLYQCAWEIAFYCKR